MNYNNFFKKYEEFIPVLMKDEFLEDLEIFQSSSSLNKYNCGYSDGYNQGYSEGYRDCKENNGFDPRY